jgi:crotonobetainyl-CoA:carnitine CoA-transferase CaiB-like acyl-CoA transferase
VMTALWARRATGLGQEVDVSIIEPLLTVLEPQLIEYDQMNTVMGRMGNRSPVNAPRNMYLARDNRWVAISTSTQSTADRLVTLVGRPDFLEHEWFQNSHERAAHTDELDEAVGSWVLARDADDVLAACREVGAPASVIFTVPDIMRDPQYAAVGAIATVDDPDLGPLRMANTPFRLSATPPRISWSGPQLGEHTDEVLGALGLSADELAELRELGVVL